MTIRERKRVLILTYYWPPSGGAGVQRWLKFSKYLRDFHYEPVIYTADNPEYPSLDESLKEDIPDELEVLKTRVWEPYALYKRFTSQKKGHRINSGFLSAEKKKGLAEKISVWIRGNLFIPDARKFWIKPSVRYLLDYLKAHRADLIVSTGPPHSMHLIALKISQKSGLPWIADFRDPWTDIDFYEDLMLSARADRKHHALEREVLQTANVITVVSKQMKEQFEILGASDVRVIPNGYDADDFDIPDDIAWLKETGSRFTITHLGSIVPSRNPVSFWKVIKRLVERDPDFARDLLLILAGKVDYSIKRAIDANHLEKWVKEIDYMPHKNAISLLKKSQVLLLLINNTANSRGILTGKFFEYLNARRPILAIGPTDGEVSSVLDETSTGRMIDFQDEITMEQCIREYYGLYKNKKLHVNARNIEKYSRRNLTGEMSTIFNELTKAL